MKVERALARDDIIDIRLSREYAFTWRAVATDTQERAMPIVQSLMDNLVRQYGKERGRSVYYAMEAEGKGPFAKGGKHHALHESFAKKHGVTPVTTKAKSKAKPRAKRRK